jgi:hypothetical protein
VETTDEVKFDGSIESAVDLLVQNEEQEQEEAPEVAEIEEPEEDSEYEAEEQPEPDVDEDEYEVAEEEQPQTYTVKIDGTETEVTLDELQRGYSGQQYIQKGMQEVADLRKKAETANATLASAGEAVLSLYQQMQQPGFAQAPTPPDESLIDSDPIGYRQDRDRYELAREKYQQDMTQMQQTLAYQQQAQQQAQQAYLEREMETLRQVMPEFSDPEKATKTRDSMLRIGTEVYGYQPEEIGAVMDHRAIRVLNDAIKYQEIMKGKQKAVEKAKPKPSSVVKAGSKKTSSNRNQSRQARSKLKRSGSINDAMSLILNER